MKTIAFILITILCLACDANIDGNNSIGANGSTLTDQVMTNYIKVYSQLKREVPEVLELVNENEPDANTHEQFAQLQKIIADYGQNYEDFIHTSAKIGTIYSISEYNMDTYNDNKNQTQGQMDDLIKTLQEILDDPDVPEDKKAEVRASIQQAQSGKSQMNNMFENNEEKAQDQMQRAHKKLLKIATEVEIQLVAKYEKELKDAYSELGRPRVAQPL